MPPPRFRARMARTTKQPSKYERPLNTDMIGSRTRLPRGRHQLEKDPDFFRSVHLVGEGLAREKEEAKRRTEELWRSKVFTQGSRSAYRIMSLAGDREGIAYQIMSLAGDREGIALVLLRTYESNNRARCVYP